MTDRDDLIALITRFGITPALAGDRPSYDDPIEGDDVYLYADHGGVDGYHTFYCRFVFDENGKFKTVGVWE